MAKTILEKMQDLMLEKYGQKQGLRISQFMAKEYLALCEQYKNAPHALERHTHKNIFPVVVTFRALLAEGIERQTAAEVAQDTFLELMNAPADSIRKLLKLPGVYRLMPRIWKMALPKLFGEDAGFRFHIYPTDHTHVKIDMFECPYLRICKELDCVDIAPCFCQSDDICYGNMHPKLIWNRTKTLARGNDVCDFDLYIQK